MNEDREVLRELWDSQLPVKFELAKEEVSTVEIPQPVFLLLPRASYFPICWDKAHKYLRHFTGNEDAAVDMWLEFDGQPLKWHIPIGVLYDICVLSNSSVPVDALDDCACLPWCVTVHFRNYPQEILRNPSMDSVKAHFISMLKEADVMKHRNPTMGSLQEKDHKSLWTGLFHARFDQFWLVNRKLMECEPNGGYRNIPFRLYDRETHYIQKPIGSFDADGQPLTLQHLLHRFTQNVASDRIASVVPPSHQAVIHGIEVPPETPLLWLCANFSHPDNFLHIVLRTTRFDQTSETAEAVPQACIRRKCSRLEQLQNASFLGGFDASVRVTLPTYSIYVSPSTSNAGSVHELVAFSFVADDHIYISISELASLAADKVKSSVKSTLKSASTLFGLTSALRSRSSDAAANQPNPEELLRVKRTKAIAAKTVSQEPRFAINERAGSERQLTRLACSPSGLYVACADNLARVLLVNVLNGLIVHIFKGYRDAQIAWLPPDCAVSNDAADPTTADLPMQTGNKTKPPTITVSHERPCLVIYEAKRGLLELWRISQPPQRIFARVVAKKARLLSTSSAMLTTPFWSASSSVNTAEGGESRMAPHISSFSREQRHQQPHAKCFLITSSSSNTPAGGSTASTPTRPLQQQLNTLIPLHLPAYMLQGDAAGATVADHTGTQQHARDLALVQSLIA